MSDQVNEGVLGSLMKNKKKGVFVLFLCILACKLPLLIALVGFGGLSTVGLLGSLPPALTQLSLIVGIVGLMLVLAYIIYLVIERKKS